MIPAAPLAYASRSLYSSPPIPQPAPPPVRSRRAGGRRVSMAAFRAVVHAREPAPSA